MIVLTWFSLFQLFARSIITDDWVRLLRIENKQLVRDATNGGDKAQFAMAEKEVLHRQSREAWERRSAELESTNKIHLVRLTELLDKKEALRLTLMDERNAALLATVQLRRENNFLRAKNHELKKKATEAFEFAKEALSEVIDTSKSWAVKACIRNAGRS